MKKIMAVGLALCIFAVLVSSASACTPGIDCPGDIKLPTPVTPSGSFDTHSFGGFGGSVGGESGSAATGCAVVTGSNTKITQVGNGGLVETTGYAGASGDNAIAQSGSISGGSAHFGGFGSATGTAQ